MTADREAAIRVVADEMRKGVSYYHEQDFEALLAELAAAREREQTLRDALAFYADASSYKEQATGDPNTFAVFDSTECPIWDDQGDIARDAFAAAEEQAT